SESPNNTSALRNKNRAETTAGNPNGVLTEIRTDIPLSVMTDGYGRETFTEGHRREFKEELSGA
ncbi:MAG: hypothetical protein R2681_15265, partial [Pyrinomonadaceae bacterium]